MPFTPPINESGDNIWGGKNGEAEQAEILNDDWWERVKYYAPLVIERVEYGESLKL